MSGTISIVSNQWATRPADERFLSLESLMDHVQARHQASNERIVDTRDFRVGWDYEKNVYDVRIDGAHPDPEHHEYVTHFSFGQLATLAKAPASYLRSLPPQLWAPAMEYSLANNGGPAKVLTLDGDATNGEGIGELRAITSEGYGRIWDEEVVQAVMDVNVDGRWHIPAASYASRDPLRATTLYASDRDVFIFMVDQLNVISIGGVNYFRGFLTWNRETYGKSFGLMCMLMTDVCDNRTIWNPRGVESLLIRHTEGGPRRFAQKAVPALAAYANSSAEPIISTIKAAERKTVGTSAEEVDAWLRSRGFTKSQAEDMRDTANKENYNPTSVWGLVESGTAMARKVKNTDDRVALERKVSDLLNTVNA